MGDWDIQLDRSILDDGDWRNEECRLAWHQAALHEYEKVFHAIAEQHEAAGGYKHYHGHKAAATI